MEKPLDQLKRKCVLVLHYEEPSKTTIAILEYLYDRRVVIETVLLLNSSSDLAILHIFCLLEKDRGKQLEFQLSKMKNMIRVEILFNNKRID